jgi:peroxiredoxin Q/BCP
MTEASALTDFELPATGTQRFRLSAFRGHPFVLYFYPKDDTPGCTVEGSDFRDLHDEFVKAKVAVFGLSRDTVASHEKFKSKMGFPFELLSDAEEKACSIFGVMKMKNMYGRQVRGVERSKIGDAVGIPSVRSCDHRGWRKSDCVPNFAQWRGVKVPGHAREVLDYVKSARL